jgi:hypothetical protein
MKKLFSLFVLLLSVLLLASCGGGKDNGGTNNPVGGGATEKLFDISGLKGTVEKDEEGNPVFGEEVRLTVWSVIGDPDQAIFRKMVDQFNDEHVGQIYLDVHYIGHFDYYNALDSAYQTDFEESFPDVCFMHNEKTIEYAYKQYFYPLDDLYEATGVDFDFSLAYDNIARTTVYREHRFGIPVDAHGFVTQFRQDIIKKNGLGFENNTRFIPNGADEYQQLLEGLRAKADKNELLVRDINKGSDHSWRVANPAEFYPSFTQSTDPDGLSALYANGGTLASEDQTTVTFHQNEGFQKYLTDQVERHNNKLNGESGKNTEMFGAGNTVMFTEGPWWIAQTYTGNWNNSELTTANEKGVSAEDAADPIISKPYVASRPLSWWTTDANKNTESGSKWYGNGHAISLTRKITDIKKVSAALLFAKWYTQGKDSKGNYNLVDWNSAGHVPAWKNVYESNGYKTLLNKNITLQALGNPADIIAMEGLEYESTLFTALSNSCVAVLDAVKSSAGCTKEQALQILNETASSCQTTLDLLKLYE